MSLLCAKRPPLTRETLDAGAEIGGIGYVKEVADQGSSPQNGIKLARAFIGNEPRNETPKNEISFSELELGRIAATWIVPRAGFSWTHELRLRGQPLEKDQVDECAHLRGDTVTGPARSTAAGALAAVRAMEAQHVEGAKDLNWVEHLAGARRNRLLPTAGVADHQREAGVFVEVVQGQGSGALAATTRIGECQPKRGLKTGGLRLEFSEHAP